MFKYPRTQHVRGSRFQNGDHDLEAVPFEELEGQHLVVEEKIDGANCGVSFSETGELLLQSRGHYLRGGPRERHFNLLKQWANTHQDTLFDILEDKYVMYGEWMYAKHTCFYDALPHYFMEFDIMDVNTKEFLSEERRNELVKGRLISQVRVLHRGKVESFKQLKSFIGPSAFYTEAHVNNLIDAANAAGVDPDLAMKHTNLSPDMEGLYIKAEKDGRVVGRYKFVREDFTNSIMDQDSHWLNRPIIVNKLSFGVDIFK